MLYKYFNYYYLLLDQQAFTLTKGSYKIWCQKQVNKNTNTNKNDEKYIKTDRQTGRQEDEQTDA